MNSAFHPAGGVLDKVASTGGWKRWLWTVFKKRKIADCSEGGVIWRREGGFGASHLHPAGGCAVPPARPAVEPVEDLIAHAFP